MPTEKRLRQKEARRAKLEQQRKKQKLSALRKRIITIVGVSAVVLLTAIWIFSSNSSTPTTTSTTTTSSASGSTTAITQAQADQRASAAGCPESTAQRVNTMQFASEPAITIDTTKQYYANFVTTAGNFRIALDAAKAPHTVNSFVFLARHGYYHCVIFHRVITDFVVQGGDPTGTGSGTPGYSFKDENLPQTGYPLYSVAMANSGANTNGSQFFIVSGPSGEALPGQYSLFGQVDEGTNVIKILNAAGNANGVPPTITHRILSVTITEK